MARRRPTSPSRAERLEHIVENLTKYAEQDQPSGRVRRPLFTDPAEHGGVDAPGWCRKQARRLTARAKKSRKNFESKLLERQKAQQRRQRCERLPEE